MKDRDFLWCLAQDLLDWEEQADRLCPQCKTLAAEPRCPACGRPQSDWGEHDANPAFDFARFQQLKGDAPLD